MSKQTVRATAATAAVLTAVAGCGASAGNDTPDSDDGTTMEVVAGGTEASRLAGAVSDIDARDDVVVLGGQGPDGTPTLWRAEGGEVETIPLPEMEYIGDVALAPDGSVFALDSSGIWRITGSQATLEVGDREAEPSGSEKGDISAIAVDDEGRLLWTASLSQPVEPSVTIHPIVVRRLEGDQATRVAGVERVPPDVDQPRLRERQENPPEGARAKRFPLIATGPNLELAADSSGIYMLAIGYVLKVSPDGSLSKVLGGDDRDPPDAPFADEGAANELSIQTDELSELSADGGRMVVTDHAFEYDNDDGGDFTWSGDFTQQQQRVVDQLMRSGSGTNGKPYEYGSVALISDGGQATTAAAHVRAAAIDGGWLYLVGQLSRPDADRQQVILVQTRIPD